MNVIKMNIVGLFFFLIISLLADSPKKKEQVKVVWLMRLSLVNKGFGVFLCAYQLPQLSFFLCFYMLLLPLVLYQETLVFLFFVAPTPALCYITDFKVFSHYPVALS